jgi:hypothetical protein
MDAGGTSSPRDARSQAELEERLASHSSRPLQAKEGEGHSDWVPSNCVGFLLMTGSSGQEGAKGEKGQKGN